MPQSFEMLMISSLEKAFYSEENEIQHIRAVQTIERNLSKMTQVVMW